MLTLEKILRRTPQKWLQNSEDCRVYKFKKIIDTEDKNPVVLAIVYSLYDSAGNRKSDPIQHKCYIKGLNGKKTAIISSNVEMSCDCAAFMYWSEVALNRKDAAPIIFSNGEDPLVRNPKLTPFPCKHLVRLTLLILNKGM